MEYSFGIILLALLQYAFFTGRVGFNRSKFEIHAPKTVGNDVWERMFRVQQNTMEQLIIFIPGMLLFAHYVSTLWVLIPGALFLIGRQTYSHMYIKSSESRGLGMVLSFFSNIALVVGGLIGLGMAIMA